MSELQEFVLFYYIYSLVSCMYVVWAQPSCSSRADRIKFILFVPFIAIFAPVASFFGQPILMHLAWNQLLTFSNEPIQSAPRSDDRPTPDPEQDKPE